MSSCPSSPSNAHIHPPGPPSGEGPLGIGAYHIPLDSEALLSWSSLVSIIQQGDLGDLNRHPHCEDKYKQWRQPIKAEFGGLEEYIREIRLGWDPPDPLLLLSTFPDHEYFRSEWSREEECGGEKKVKCIPNDWPYGIPPGCGHYVVWSISPILHEALFESEDTPFPEGQRRGIYDAVSQDGVRGLTGMKGAEEQVVGLYTMAALEAKEEVETIEKDRDVNQDTINGLARNGHAQYQQEMETTRSLAQRAQAWAGRHVNAYVKEKWPEDQWETAWFCNPPHLRTVPGLSHFQSVSVMSYQPITESG